MNDEDVLGAFLLVNNPIVLSEEETKDVQKAIKKLQQEIKKVTIQQKEFINYLEDEKDCFVRGCSNVYEDGLGRTRLVNEDIFDEIDNILQKYREIIGVSDETN